MPVTVARGDIYQTASQTDCELIILFGRTGFNGIHPQFFSETFLGLHHYGDLPRTADDPCIGQHIKFTEGKWFACYFDTELDGSFGLSDESIVMCLANSFRFAKSKGLRRIITNGEHDLEPITQHAPKEHERNRRAAFLIDFVQLFGHFDIILITEGNVFLRNKPKRCDILVIDQGSMAERARRRPLPQQDRPD